jgi:hypothetical protein
VANFQELNDFLNERSNVRILILDNNNIQFCCQYEEHFPVEEIYKQYDLILIPGWVHAEVSHSENRLLYLARILKPLINLVEEDDYLPLVTYEDLRLMKVFEGASSAYPKSLKFFKGLKEVIGRTGEIPDDWISDYYENGFDIRENGNGVALKKNAGEVSILSLTFLLVHKYSSKLSQITIGSSDQGSWDIKHKILDYIGKREVLKIPFPPIPISFKSTDALLVEAVKSKIITSEEVITKLRPNPRSCIYIRNLPDGTSETVKGVIDTPAFIQMLKEIDIIHLLF